MVRIKWPFSKREKKAPTSSWLCSPGAYEVLCQDGYTPLNRNPDVRICVDKIADLVSSMTVYLMTNTPTGDRRVVNGLSRMLDITPTKALTKKDWLYLLVRTLLLDGEGNAVIIPIMKDGLIEELIPVPPSQVSYRPAAGGYVIVINGVEYDPATLIHFKWNPDPDAPFWGAGVRVLLREVVTTLKQATATTRDFLNKPRPGVIVNVDSTEQDLQTIEGRRVIFDKYVKSVDTGDAWVIPGEIIKIEQLKPQSLKDLAISDSVTLDRRFITALFGVPRFFLGTDQYNRGEHNYFVTTRIMHFCQIISQELTRKLLIAPCMYFKFNPRSLYDYSITELSNIGTKLRPAGVMTGNEVRDWIGLDPSDSPGMDEFSILENYIPVDDIGDQKKLKGGDGTGSAEN